MLQPLRSALCVPTQSRPIERQVCGRQIGKLQTSENKPEPRQRATLVTTEPNRECLTEKLLVDRCVGAGSKLTFGRCG
jgi:hypothetical protein